MTSGSQGVLRIGTRRSALARAQAEGVARMLTDRGHVCSIIPMSTRGDAGAAIPLSAGGVKGLFVDEIVTALRDGEIDVAVHSAKDLPAYDPDGVVVAAVPPRAPVEDVLVTREGRLATGAVVGTASLRRRAQMLRWRPDLRVVEIRGNVDTRLGRLREEDLDGLLLARAGLVRLGLNPRNAQVLDTSVMLPAPAQGFLAIQTLFSGPGFEAARALNDRDARRTWNAERYLVRLLGADCALPVGAYARPSGTGLHLAAGVFSPDGTAAMTVEVDAENAAVAAREAATRLFDLGAADVLAPYVAEAS